MKSNASFKAPGQRTLLADAQSVSAYQVPGIESNQPFIPVDDLDVAAVAEVEDELLPTHPRLQTQDVRVVGQS
ncbi:MAG: hypothetical protein WCK77_02555 [Verrucomicrobiota bacterium]